MSVPLSTLKLALRIDYDDDDATLIQLRETACSAIERDTQLLLSPATKTMYLSGWRDTLIPAHPFVSFSGITYTDATQQTITMPATDYWIDWADGPMPMLRFLQKPQNYPGTQPIATYVAGYSVWPNEVTRLVVALVGHWYANPHAADGVTLQTAPLSVQYMIELLSTRSRLR